MFIDYSIQHSTLYPVLGSTEQDTSEAMDIKKYAKYLLEEGSMDEKREMLSHLHGKLTLSDKKIALVK